MLKKLKEKHRVKILIASMLAQPHKMVAALLAVQNHFNKTPVKDSKEHTLDMCKKMKVLGLDIN